MTSGSQMLPLRLIVEPVFQQQQVAGIDYHVVDHENGRDLVFSSPPFTQAPGDYFRGVYSRIEELRHDSDCLNLLRNIGVELSSFLLPLSMREFLSDLPINYEAIHVSSGELWIPWEILCFQDSETGEVSPFLAEEYILTRWIRAVEEVPSQVSIDPLAIVAPPDSSLTSQHDEAQFIKNLFEQHGLIATVLGSSRKEITNTIASGKYSSLHFAGHGLARSRDPNRWGVRLNPQEDLSLTDLGVAAARFRQKPGLIFLNACSTARAALSLSGFAGLCDTFLKAGGGAFIGTNWEIEDSSAKLFAMEFYKAWLELRSLPLAMTKAREQLRTSVPNSIDWLAYSIYCNSTVRVADSRPMMQHILRAQGNPEPLRKKSFEEFAATAWGKKPPG